MELALLVWLIGSLESIKFVCMMVVVCLCGYFAWQVLGEEKINKGLVVLSVLLVLIFTVIPSSKTAWMMTAAYAGQSVVQSDTAKKLGVLIEKKLEGLIEEADSQAKGKIKEVAK